MLASPILAAACGALAATPTGAVWPWNDNRYFSGRGSTSDDLAFAGLPTDGGSAFVTTGDTSCPCDLTAAACDAFCCCDSACSSFERDTLYECAAASAAPMARAGVRMCTDAVADHNLPDTTLAAWEEDPEDPLDRVLCVVVDNSASYGNFIAPLDKLETESAVDAAISHNSSFDASQADTLPSPATNNYYEPGQAINLGSTAGGSAEAVDYAPARMPQAVAGGGACVEAPLRFLETHAPSACITVLDETARGCSADGAFDASRFDGLRLATSGLDPDSSDYDSLTVSVASLDQIDYVTGARTSLPTSSVPAPLTNDTAVCGNALVEAVLRVRYETNGRLDKVDAHLAITDVPLPAVDKVARVERVFGVLFEPSDAGEDWRPRSGRPGYLPGLPLLSGKQSSGDVRQSPQGLVALVSRAADGRCDFAVEPPVLVTPGPYSRVANVVRFGEDALFSCELGWSLAELRSKCEGDDQQRLQNLTDPFVGRYGDAYGSQDEDWVEVVSGDSGGDPSWDEDELTCSDLVVGASYEVLVSKYGAAVDLQRQIIGVRLSFRTATWRYATSPRQLYTVTVAFTEVPAGDEAEFVPPAPGLFAPLPDDVFFPFTVQVSDASVTATAATTSAARRRS